MIQAKVKSSWIVRRGAPLVVLTIVVGMIAWMAFPGHLGAQDGDAQELQGDFTVGLNRDDIPKDLPNGPSLIGQWRISFNADGIYEMERLDIGTVVTGTFEVDGSTLTITDEAGLLSCANELAANADQNDTATGTYQFTQTGERLSLTPQDERCDSRRLILGTRELIGFVQCFVSATLVVTEGTPAASPVASPVATEEATPESIVGRLQPDVEEDEEEPETPDASPEATGVEAEIDALLDQMTACWATGEPARFLPLVTEDYRAELASQYPSEDEFLAGLGAAMGTPLTFERSGDIQRVGADEIEVIVRTETGPEESFVRFSFVRDEGDWKWNGPA